MKTIENSFISKRGFTHFTHQELTFDQHCIAYPSERVFEENGVYVQKSFIAQTHRETAVVFFVSGTNGDEFGQFPTKETAVAQAKAMAVYPENQRKQFDR